MSKTLTGTEQALENFLASKDFKEGAISSTKASWSGSSYKVELFDSGDYRVLWANQIGNRYETPGVILTIPTIDDSELSQYSGTDEFPTDEAYLGWVFDQESDELAAEMRADLAELN